MYLLERIFALIAFTKAAILTVDLELSIGPGGSCEERFFFGGVKSSSGRESSKMMLDWKFGGRAIGGGFSGNRRCWVLA